jgi:anti-sigma factor RsiW
MCDERDRLLDYLYDACDAGERRTVERHIQSCEACRTEISELRAVRLDLLAWDVPEHESVWKPFAPARVRPWYREVPGWALAAAASLTFLLGMGGGIVSQSLLSPPAATTPSAAATAAVRPAAPVLTPQITVSPTSRDEAAMEARILRAVQSRLDEQLRPIAAHAQLASQQLSAETQEMRRLLQVSEDRQAQAINRLRLNWLTDADRTYVSNSRFNTFKKEEFAPGVRGVLVSYEQAKQD